jgi:hypothetical protein
VNGYQLTQAAFVKASVLIGQLEIIIFEETVHKDDELAHAGGHGHEGFLAGVIASSYCPPAIGIINSIDGSPTAAGRRNIL